MSLLILSCYLIFFSDFFFKRKVTPSATDIAGYFLDTFSNGGYLIFFFFFLGGGCGGNGVDCYMTN